jgi:hypothetical protein
MEIDLHGYHPDEIVHDELLDKIVQQAWEMGETRLCLIHGHGRNRGISPGFVNTNTGYFGLRIRSALRHATELRQWIKVSTLDCSHPGATSIDLKGNPTPTRTELARPAPSVQGIWRERSLVRQFSAFVTRIQNKLNFAALHLLRCKLRPTACGAFLLKTFQLQASALLHGDSHEKWIKETRLDIRTGS